VVRIGGVLVVRRARVIRDVREIYSSTFLHPQSVLNDIRTLLMEK
jgi:hypothetical protein